MNEAIKLPERTALFYGGEWKAPRSGQYRDVAAMALIGSVPAGKAVMCSATDTLKHVLLELGGKNALIAFPDADPDKVAATMVSGMNFGWRSQSCGLTNRALLHEAIDNAVPEHIPEKYARFKPGLPKDAATTIGPIVSEKQYEIVKHYIAAGLHDGAHSVYGGRKPNAPELAGGCYMEPTAVAEVTPEMRIAREGIFGPVLSVMRWHDEEEMLRIANGVEYGLTCLIWTNDVSDAHRTTQRIDAGFVWINKPSRHFPGKTFGSFKQSGVGREECLEEQLTFTQEKHIHIRLKKQHHASSDRRQEISANEARRKTDFTEERTWAAAMLAAPNEPAGQAARRNCGFGSR